MKEKPKKKYTELTADTIIHINKGAYNALISYGKCAVRVRYMNTSIGSSFRVQYEKRICQVKIVSIQACAESYISKYLIVEPCPVFQKKDKHTNGYGLSDEEMKKKREMKFLCSRLSLWEIMPRLDSWLISYKKESSWLELVQIARGEIKVKFIGEKSLQALLFCLKEEGIIDL